MKIRTRLLAVFVAFVLTAVLGFMYLIAEEIKPRYREAQEEVLVDFSEMLAALVSENAVTTDPQGTWIIKPTLLNKTFEALKLRSLDAKIYDLAKKQVDTRVYITDKEGTVIFDSDNGRDVGVSYALWRDVHKTLSGEYGVRTSLGDPIYPDGNTMYIARPVLANGDIIGVLSVGKPTRNADAFISNLTNKLSATGAALAIVATLVGLMINLWLTRPLDKIQRYALSVSRGENAVLPKMGNNEVGDVGKALQSMRKALDGKTYIEEYVHSLTHEIKAPIAGIRGAAELLKEPIPETQQQKFLSNIVSQTERIQHIVERLLDLSELENTETLSLQDKVNLNELITDVCQSQEDYAKAHSTIIDVTTDKSTLKCDRFLLAQAITNLIKNAIEHAEHDSTIYVQAVSTKNKTTITVSNKGNSIPDYALPNLFNRFYSLPNREGIKGSGIGLSFVREIVKLHSGDVAVESSEGKTIFKISV